MSYNYGDPVAIRFGTTIEFGVVTQIVRTKTKDGETIAHHIKTANSFGEAIISDEDKIWDLSRSYGLEGFINGSDGYKWARRAAKAIENERENPNTPVAAEPPTPLPPADSNPNPPTEAPNPKAGTKDEEIPF